MSLWEYANPVKFLRLSERVLPVLWVLAAASVGTGLIWGFFFTPDERLQGSTVKILFLHVPAALMAINAWFMMLVASLIWLIRRHHVSALAAKAAAPVGVVFTLIALVTGAIWGQPIWGTWVGLGPAIDLVPDPVFVLPWLHRPVGSESRIRIQPPISHRFCALSDQCSQCCHATPFSSGTKACTKALQCPSRQASAAWLTSFGNRC